MRHVIAISLLVSIFAVPVLGDDLIPPPWRGDPTMNTTYARWEFPTGADPAIADEWINPWGEPSLNPTPGAGMAYWDLYEGRQGVWPLSGQMLITIPNSPEPNPIKEMWVQLTWWPQNVDSKPSIEIVDPAGLPWVLDPIDQQVLADGWIHSIFQIIIEPNPPIETIQIWGTVNMDEVVIDTRCFPEPASLSLLALGGVALLRRRR